MLEGLIFGAIYGGACLGKKMKESKENSQLRQIIHDSHGVKWYYDRNNQQYEAETGRQIRFLPGRIETMTGKVLWDQYQDKFKEEYTETKHFKLGYNEMLMHGLCVIEKETGKQVAYIGRYHKDYSEITYWDNPYPDGMKRYYKKVSAFRQNYKDTKRVSNEIFLELVDNETLRKYVNYCDSIGTKRQAHPTYH